MSSSATTNVHRSAVLTAMIRSELLAAEEMLAVQDDLRERAAKASARGSDHLFASAFAQSRVHVSKDFVKLADAAEKAAARHAERATQLARFPLCPAPQCVQAHSRHCPGCGACPVPGMPEHLTEDCPGTTEV